MKIKFDFSLPKWPRYTYLEDFGASLKQGLFDFNEFKEFTDTEKTTEIKRGYAIFEELKDKQSELKIDDLRNVMRKKGLADNRLQDFIIFLWMQGTQKVFRGSLINLPGSVGEYLKAILMESIEDLPQIAFEFSISEKKLVSQQGDIWEWESVSDVTLIDPTQDALGLTPESNLGKFTFRVRVDLSKLNEKIKDENVLDILEIKDAVLELNDKNKYAKKIVSILKGQNVKKLAPNFFDVPTSYFTLPKLFERIKADDLHTTITFVDEIYRAEISKDKISLELPIESSSDLSNLIDQLDQVEDLSQVSIVLSDNLLTKLMEDEISFHRFVELLRKKISIRLQTELSDKYKDTFIEFLEKLPKDVVLKLELPQIIDDKYKNVLSKAIFSMSEEKKPINLILNSLTEIDYESLEFLKDFLSPITYQAILTVKVSKEIYDKKNKELFIDNLNKLCSGEIKDGSFSFVVDDTKTATRLFKILQNGRVEFRSKLMVVTEDASTALFMMRKFSSNMTTLEAIEMLRKFPDDNEIVQRVLNRKMFSQNLWKNFSIKQIREIGELAKSNPVVLRNFLSNTELIKKFGISHIKELLEEPKTKFALSQILKEENKIIKNNIRQILQSKTKSETEGIGLPVKKKKSWFTLR